MKEQSVLRGCAFAVVCAVLVPSIPAIAQSGAMNALRPLHVSPPISQYPHVPPAPGMGAWQPITNQAQFPEIIDPDGNDWGAGAPAAPLLMTDGSILVQDSGWYGNDVRVFRFSPDIHGSYVNGTWSEVASKPYANNAGSNAVLADGRVLVEGGEYSGYGYNFTLTNQGAIYDPVANTWTSVDPPSFFVDLYPPRALFAPNPLGDAPNVVLSNGTFMIEDKMSAQAALLNLKTLTWTETNHGTKSDWNDEEGLTLLPDGQVLTVDCYTNYFFGISPGYPSNPTNSEIYTPSIGDWQSAGSTIHTLTDPALSEMGPAMLRPDGTVFALGSSGDSSIYSTLTHRWSLGPTLPISPQGSQYTVQDGPAALLPDGNVLLAATGGPEEAWNGNYSIPPVAFFEFDGKNLNPEPTIPNTAEDMSGSISFLLLPTGQVMEVDQTDDVEIYTPANTGHNPAWQPVVTSVASRLQPGGSYELQGIRLNGMSQGCAFGDELQCATNYPLVRITNLATRHVFYSRTHDHSSMGVAENRNTSTHFDVPAAQEKGPSLLEVVANGIASTPVPVNVQ